MRLPLTLQPCRVSHLEEMLATISDFLRCGSLNGLLSSLDESPFSLCVHLNALCAAARFDASVGLCAVVSHTGLNLCRFSRLDGLMSNLCQELYEQIWALSYFMLPQVVHESAVYTIQNMSQDSVSDNRDRQHSSNRGPAICRPHLQSPDREQYLKVLCLPFLSS